MCFLNTTNVSQCSTGVRLSYQTWHSLTLIRTNSQIAQRIGIQIRDNPCYIRLHRRVCITHAHWGPLGSCLNHVARQLCPLLAQREADSNRLLHDVFRQDNEVAFVITMWCVFLKPFSTITNGQHEGMYNMCNIQFPTLTIPGEENTWYGERGFVKRYSAFSLSHIFHKYTLNDGQ